MAGDRKYCNGCRDDFYNHRNEPGFDGSTECWSLKSADIVWPLHLWRSGDGRRELVMAELVRDCPNTLTNYREWIAANVPADCHGLCVQFTDAMAEAFPELRRVRGHYTPFAGRERSHWWLETVGGEIVDPTSAQFEDGGRGDYREYLGAEPTGHCLDCGALMFHGGTFCNEACARSTHAYLRDGGRIFVNGFEL